MNDNQIDTGEILNAARGLHFEDCFYRTHHGRCSCSRGVVIELLIAERIAVRSLLTRLEQCEGSRRVHELDNHHNALACGYCNGPLKDELLRLQRLTQ